jgi:hypothetical protein
MKKNVRIPRIGAVLKTVWIVLFLTITTTLFRANAQTNPPLRRPISPQQPMWLVHIDTWNYADPQKIIDLIPADIRPFVVMNISLSINHDTATGRFLTCEYGYETAKSWLRACAENRMWAVVQPSSGGFSQFSDFDLSVYEEFYREYPNFIGFNYAEQFWGYDDKFSVTWTQRIAHWVNLMKLNQKYGGYLITSFCGMYWGANLNPVAMMKRNPAFAKICKEDPEHFILCEKYTSTYGFHDIESTSQGSYLSGFAGQYGIRFDQCGWVGTTSSESFPVPAGAAPVIEHLMLTGETVIDGPELIWQQCFRELSAGQTSDGFSMRRWDYYPQFRNISMDIFRKVLDGSIRIMDRKEVIDRTKVVIVNDVTSGGDQAMYSSPETLFDGLYRMDSDGTYLNNKGWFKKTGRYPTIPTVYLLADSLANTFKVKVNKSAYSTRWPSIASKQTEFNALFPQEYTGDIYAGRSENSWVVYNPYKTGQIAKGSIPFKYNTSDHMELSLDKYTTGIIQETADNVSFYLTNYDNTNTALRSDTLCIYGSSVEPTFTYQDRSIHQASTVTKDWSNGVYTLYVKHNGPLDINVNCAGTATERLTSFKKANYIEPAIPPVYTGPRQYEAENMDYKSVSQNVTSATYAGVSNYTGQGFMKFGGNQGATIRDTISVIKSGTYRFRIKYMSPNGSVSGIRFYVNGVLKSTPYFPQTASNAWSVCIQSADLKAGKNVIMLYAFTTNNNIYFDNIIVDRDDNSFYTFTNDVASTAASTPAAEMMNVKSGSAGVVSYTDAANTTSNAFKPYSGGAVHQTGVADLNLFPTSSTNYYVTWKEYNLTSGGKKGVLLRGSTDTSAYAQGMKQGYLFVSESNPDNTLTLHSYVAGADGLTEKTAFTTGFQVPVGQPCWFRATANGNQLKFECSTDNVNWTGADNTTFTDNTYSIGTTQLAWGFDSDKLDFVLDDIYQGSRVISLSKFTMSSFSAEKDKGPSVAQSLTVGARGLSSNLQLTVPEGYEISKSAGSGYTSTLSLSTLNGDLGSTPIYVRLKEGLSVKDYTGNLTASTDGLSDQTVTLSGSVLPQSVYQSYDFNTDAPTTFAGTPPAFQVSVAPGNTATAGVVSFTDTKGVTSNRIRAYSAGQRNGTGALDLKRFSNQSTDYSVTWKECIGTAGTDYKVGMLLRGDSLRYGDAATYYVDGLRQGYAFIVYNNASQTQFRIYRSTSSTSLSMLVNTSASLVPTVGQPVWYRASVAGKTSVALKLQYSTDSITWNTGASATDQTSPVFTAGSTQLIWGLAAGGQDFYMDNITFYGAESANGSIATGINAPEMDNATLERQEYFSLTGARVDDRRTLKGLYIVRNYWSNGSITTSKVFLR